MVIIMVKPIIAVLLFEKFSLTLPHNFRPVNEKNTRKEKHL